MVVWHVCSLKKIKRYMEAGCILPPVRAWRDISHVPGFAIGTGRKVVLRLKFPDDTPALEGHKGGAVVLDKPFPFPPKGGL